VAEVRVGLGFDSHPSEEARLLVLGGVPFPGAPGLAGHSDGDVICHALADALLGGGALGDIGQHFPEDDPAIAGIGGLEILSRVTRLLQDARLRPASCDLVVIAARPHLSERREELRRSLAAALGLPPDAVSVKATRPEGLGLAGDGIGCMAVAVLEEA
jgi:2-C-methyl-D-erythritol 2,4-cyclodiphosphate synthase